MGAIFLPIGIMINSIALVVLGAMGLGMGIMTIIPLPLKTGILYIDGYRWKRLKVGGQEANEEIALFRVTEYEILHGDFLKFDYRYIESLIKSKDSGTQYYGYYYRYRYYKARKNETEMISSIKSMESIQNNAPKFIVDNLKKSLKNL